jgi:glycosyltransferase involved in cell wall biosynthesis
MLKMSERLPVLFVNSIGMRTPLPGKCTQPAKRIFRKLSSIMKGLRKVGPAMWVYSPLMLPPGSSPLVRKINARLIANQVRRALMRIGIGRWFTWVTVPTAVDMLDFLPRTVTVFNRSDKHCKFPEAREDFIKSCEEKLLQTSDVVLYVNRKLMAEDMCPHTRKYYIGHGVDYEHFAGATNDKASIQPELAGLRRPIVGFCGAIDDYTVDLELLKYAARSLTEMSFVLIGLSTVDISDIASLPNVRYLGFRPYSDIPKFGANFDVGIMPWLQNDWIEYCNPVKLKEYLALGIPVVTTPIPQASEYPHLLNVANTSEGFVQAIRTAIAADNAHLRQVRRKAVENDSWQHKADEVLQLVSKIADGTFGLDSPKSK